MSKRVYGYLTGLSAIAIFLLQANYNLTGYSVGFSSVKINFAFFLAVMLLAASLFILAGRITLDAIIIPTSASEERTRQKVAVALDYRKRYGAKLIVASGGKTPGLSPRYRHGAQVVYEKLREAGIKPGEIRIDGKSMDNLENILFSLKKIKGTNVGIVSYPMHLDRFEYIIRKAQEEGIIDNRIKVYRIETDEKLVEKLYEIPASILTHYRLRDGAGKAREENKLAGGGIKRAVNYLMKLFLGK